MSFVNDAFISYAHIDNEPLPTKTDGWVTLFDKTLRQRLSVKLGKKAVVWRDPKLAGNDIFSDEIDSELERAAVLISVVSPRYVKSESCDKEITRFYEVATKDGRILIGNKCRIFKVIKSPLGKDDALPAAVAGLAGKMLGYQFYQTDDSDTPIELDPAFSEVLGQEFLRKVNTVASNIKDLLDELSGAIVKAPKAAVFLAECARDRRDGREMVQAELQRLGYTVLPDRELSLNETEYIAEVEEMLSRSSLSVHFIGNALGEVTDTTQKSIVLLQNEIAANASRKHGLRRIISIPAQARGANPAQQAFIDALHSEADLQFGADLITGGIEDLKSAISAALKDLETPKEEPRETTEPLVYVMCDPRDLLNSVPLKKSLIARGARVETTVFTGEAKRVREANTQLLMTADAVVLFYGAGDDTWKFFQQSEIQKSRGMRRGHPPFVCTYVAGPATDEKTAIVATEKNIINGLVDLPEGALTPLLQALHLDGDGGKP
ncbi:MAG TPA: toll/interleukin-1 receptor domain-containing protein [Thermoanaerobaculia bacterium]|jgi:hypothetical protein|nr:toll/interleukin-1 receptor domain-containing protein [Thermoanaerobaculia bacterium]